MASPSCLSQLRVFDVLFSVIQGQIESMHMYPVMSPIPELRMRHRRETRTGLKTYQDPANTVLTPPEFLKRHYGTIKDSMPRMLSNTTQEHSSHPIRKTRCSKYRRNIHPREACYWSS